MFIYFCGHSEAAEPVKNMDWNFNLDKAPEMGPSIPMKAAQWDMKPK